MYIQIYVCKNQKFPEEKEKMVLSIGIYGPARTVFLMTVGDSEYICHLLIPTAAAPSAEHTC